jgi:hypothetical protein
MFDKSEQAGQLCGRRAAERYRRAAAEGTPLANVPVIRPTQEWRDEAERMVLSDEPHIRDSGRWWLAYFTAFDAIFPEFVNQ